MGWLFSSRWETRAELVKHLQRPDRFLPGKRLASRVIGNHHWYLAETNGTTWIGLDLMQGGGSRDPGWGYKDLDETVGPTALDCPLSFLDRASEPVHYAIEWRQRVREHHAALTTKAKPVPGLKVSYGGQVYELFRSLGRKGWEVMRSDGVEFRMKAHQVSKALMSPAGA